jgi:ribose 5-phosphate isomerase B
MRGISRCFPPDLADSHSACHNPIRIKQECISMRVAIGSDHAGFGYKQLIVKHLEEKGHECTDFGTHSDASVDYPDFIVPVARAVAAGEYERGIVLGGSGNGEAIAAYKVRGIR